MKIIISRSLILLSMLFVVIGLFGCQNNVIPDETDNNKDNAEEKELSLAAEKANVLFSDFEKDYLGTFNEENDGVLSKAFDISFSISDFDFGNDTAAADLVYIDGTLYFLSESAGENDLGRSLILERTTDNGSILLASQGNISTAEVTPDFYSIFNSTISSEGFFDTLRLTGNDLEKTEDPLVYKISKDYLNGLFDAYLAKSLPYDLDEFDEVLLSFENYEEKNELKFLLNIKDDTTESFVLIRKAVEDSGSVETKLVVETPRFSVSVLLGETSENLINRSVNVSYDGSESSYKFSISKSNEFEGKFVLNGKVSEITELSETTTDINILLGIDDNGDITDVTGGIAIPLDSGVYIEAEINYDKAAFSSFESNGLTVALNYSVQGDDGQLLNLTASKLREKDNGAEYELLVKYGEDESLSSRVLLSVPAEKAPELSEYEKTLLKRADTYLENYATINKRTEELTDEIRALAESGRVTNFRNGYYTIDEEFDVCYITLVKGNNSTYSNYQTFCVIDYENYLHLYGENKGGFMVSEPAELAVELSEIVKSCYLDGYYIGQSASVKYYIYDNKTGVYAYIISDSVDTFNISATPPQSNSRYESVHEVKYDADGNIDIHNFRVYHDEKFHKRYECTECCFYMSSIEPDYSDMEDTNN